jgi:branched-chain amino acid transport system substrate-binding protein
VGLVRTAAVLLVLAGCLGGDESGDGSRVSSGTLTVYTSLPRTGVSEPVARAVAAGERLALSDSGGRAWSRRVRLVRVSSNDPDDDLWDPDRVSANARRATDVDTAIAYIGELDYGGSAVSLPITNDAGILQVSPFDGLTSLTRTPPGLRRAGPERY